MKRRLSRTLLLSALGLCGANLALATPVPSGLSITGKVSLDTVNSTNVSGGATQSGTLKHVSAGVTTSSSFTGAPAGLSPSLLTGALSSTGDGIGAKFDMSGTGVGANNSFGLFADYALSLSNTSLVETYVVTFRGVFSNSVAATGADSFAFSNISVLDAALNELLFSDYKADTVNGNSNTNSASSTFSVTLNPGASASFSALQKQRGGVFADTGGTFSARLDAFLLVDDVVTRGGEPLPLPGTLPLLALSLGVLALKHRRT